MSLPIDSLVRGKVGHSDHIEDVRVYRVTAFGWVGGINANGRQRIVYEYEVIEGPRPLQARTDIPGRLQ